MILNDSLLLLSGIPEFTAHLTLYTRSRTFSNASSFLFEILAVVILVCQSTVSKYDSHYIIHVS
jgi:hypothetical protein